VETLEEEEDITTTDSAVAAAKDHTVVVVAVAKDLLEVNRITLIIIAFNRLDNNNHKDSVVGNKCNKDLNNKCINKGLINHNNLCLIIIINKVVVHKEVLDFLKTHNMDKCLDYLQASNDDHNKYMLQKIYVF